jgi:hypothetical protein
VWRVRGASAGPGPDGYAKVDELKEELEARGEATSGSKAWLRRRLHAAIVREYLDAERWRTRLARASKAVWC